MVIGSSLKVQPVALIPYNVNPEVPQILINRESLPHYATDIQLLGNCDDIVTQLALALGRPFTDIFNKGLDLLLLNCFVIYFHYFTALYLFVTAAIFLISSLFLTFPAFFCFFTFILSYI